MPIIEDALRFLGTDMLTHDVEKLVNDYNLADVYDDPPFNKYIGSEKKGIDLLFEGQRLTDIQIYVQPSSTHAAFIEELPFGLMAGMTEKDIQQVIGEAEEFDSTESRYYAKGGSIKIAISFDEGGIMRYISVGTPE